MTSPGVQECGLCASSAHDVHHASVCVNVVIGVFVVLCECNCACSRHFTCGAVVGLTLGLIVHVVVVVFVAAMLHNFLYLEVHSLHLPSVTVNCCWLLPNFHFNFCTQFVVRFIPQVNRPFTDFHSALGGTFIAPSVDNKLLGCCRIITVFGAAGNNELCELHDPISAKYCRTGTSASLTARAGISCEMEQKENKKYLKFS